MAIKLNETIKQGFIEQYGETLVLEVEKEIEHYNTRKRGYNKCEICPHSRVESNRYDKCDEHYVCSINLFDCKLESDLDTQHIAFAEMLKVFEEADNDN